MLSRNNTFFDYQQTMPSFHHVDFKILFPAVLLLRLAISYIVIPPSHPTALSNEGKTASQQFSRIDIIPIASRSSRFFYHAPSSSHYNSNPLFTPFLLLAGDVELNPGPSSAYTLRTLNIRSLLNNSHAIVLSDIAESHRPDLFCLTETWIKPTTTSTELIDQCLDIHLSAILELHVLKSPVKTLVVELVS